MKVIARIALVAFVLSVFSQAALAQQAPGYGPGSGRTFAPENFPDVKARVLQAIDDRRAGLDREKACVEKSQNSEELRKCRPAPPKRGRGERGPRGQSDAAPQSSGTE